MERAPIARAALMPDTLDLRRSLAAHLEFYRDLGVAGISRDPVWGRRQSAADIDVNVDVNVDVVQAGTAQEPRPEPQLEPQLESEPASRSGQESHPETVSEMARKTPPASTPVAAARGTRPAATRPDDPSRGAGAELADIRADIGDCTRCKLHGQGRQQIVFGVGNPRADLMFVGEAPGRDEDIQGEPFVGRAGQLLTKIIEAIGLTRDDVYIANVIKCRPPENRNPEPDEIATCEPFLFRQIDAIKPRVIVALGTFAAQTLLKTNASISGLRGQTHEYRGAQLIATFHPAFLLRSPERKRDTWEDMKKVRALLQGEGA